MGVDIAADYHFKTQSLDAARQNFALYFSCLRSYQLLLLVTPPALITAPSTVMGLLTAGFIVWHLWAESGHKEHRHRLHE